MIRKGDRKSSSSFLIDLDFAVKIDRAEASGAGGITSTRAFIAIGVLMGEGHTFIDNLESFFWVLFWTYVHYNQHSRGRKTDFTK